jgi:transposase-like protein
MEEKLRFVMQYDSGEYTMSELCQRYGISRETGYVSRWCRNCGKRTCDSASC